MKLRSVTGSVTRRVTLNATVGLAALAAALLIGGATASAASADRGRVEFLKHGCWQCHGERGQGGVTGPKLAPDPLPFDALSNFVRTTNRNMPPFRKEILSDDDLADIYAYLQSMPKGPDPKSITLLDP
jgi:mono/diheme cytochrome c family protein